MVEISQVEVSQVLTCEVADRQSLFLTVTIYYLIQQPQHLLIGNRISYQPYQLPKPYAHPPYTCECHAP